MASRLPLAIRRFVASLHQKLREAFSIFKERIVRAYTRRPIDNLDHTRNRAQQTAREARRANPADEMPAWGLSVNFGGDPEPFAPVERSYFDPETITATGRMAGMRTARNYPIQASMSHLFEQDFAEIERRIMESSMRMPAAIVRMDSFAQAFSRGAVLDDDFTRAVSPFRPTPQRKAEPIKPHPCAGMVVAKPLRTMCGNVVEDVRMADGTVARRAIKSPPK